MKLSLMKFKLKHLSLLDNKDIESVIDSYNNLTDNQKTKLEQIINNSYNNMVKKSNKKSYLSNKKFLGIVSIIGFSMFFGSVGLSNFGVEIDNRLLAITAISGLAVSALSVSLMTTDDFENQVPNEQRDKNFKKIEQLKNLIDKEKIKE